MKPATSGKSGKNEPTARRPRLASLRIAVKRVYDQPEAGDGMRILIDRLWPRGLSKAELKLDVWPKELSPSNELRNGTGMTRSDMPNLAAVIAASLPHITMSSRHCAP